MDCRSHPRQGGSDKMQWIVTDWAAVKDIFFLQYLFYSILYRQACTNLSWAHFSQLVNCSYGCINQFPMIVLVEY